MEPALRLHFGSDGVGRQADLGSREPLLLAFSRSRLRGLGSAVLLQPVTRPSSSLLGCLQLPDRIQVPHHHPGRVDDHCEVGFSPEATDDIASVDILGLIHAGAGKVELGEGGVEAIRHIRPAAEEDQGAGLTGQGPQEHFDVGLLLGTKMVTGWGPCSRRP